MASGNAAGNSLPSRALRRVPPWRSRRAVTVSLGAGGRRPTPIFSTRRRPLLSVPCGTLRRNRSHNLSRVVICENARVQSSYVDELIHCARGPQLHVALPPRARQQRDGARLDGDDARRHGGERPPSDDAPAPDASVLVPSWSFSHFLDD